MRHPLSLRATAYHESGHAVAAWALGFPIVVATIVPGDGYGGMVKVGRPPVPKAFLQNHEERAVIDMAGPAAQSLYASHSAVRHGATHDLAAFDLRTDEIFYKRDGCYPPDDRKRPFARLIRRQARRLMVEHWLAVHHVATRLLDQRSLSGFAVARICREATDEWAQIAPYHSGRTAVDYVRETIRAARPLPPLRRATLAAATLRAVLAGAPDVAGAVSAALIAKGYNPEQCRTAWLASARRSHDAGTRPRNASGSGLGERLEG